MNQLSLQCLAWGTVTSVVAAAVWLAVNGDAANMEQRDFMAPSSQRAVAKPKNPVQPTVYSNQAIPRATATERATFSLPRPARGRDDS